MSKKEGLSILFPGSKPLKCLLYVINCKCKFGLQTRIFKEFPVLFFYAFALKSGSISYIYSTAWYCYLYHQFKFQRRLHPVVQMIIHRQHVKMVQIASLSCRTVTNDSDVGKVLPFNGGPKTVQKALIEKSTVLLKRCG